VIGHGVIGVVEESDGAIGGCTSPWVGSSNCFPPPPCTGVFPDVPCSLSFAPWIEQLAEEGITGGCGGGNYCPGSNVTRGQMAVFIDKAFELQ